MSDLRDFIQQHDHTSIGLYLVEFDRLVEQYEGEKARALWRQEVVNEAETTERTLREQKATYERALKAIAFNAKSFHKGEDGKRSEEHTSELQSHHDLVCRL